MHISLRHTEQVGRYLLNGSEIVQSDSEKDIGVHIDPNLNFQKHMQTKINKANSTLGIILRTMQYKDANIILALYKALVRPHLEFANQVWCPILIKDITLLESIQRRMTRAIPGLQHLSYEERLRRLDLPTLAYRRLRGDFIETYKILTGKYDPGVTNNLFELAEDRRTRGHQLKVKRGPARTNRRNKSFFIRTVDP